VEDLLHASQIMRGAIELERAPTDLRQVVREAANLTEATTRERRQQMTVRMDDQPLPVLADTSRIRQVLTNIMTNAAKYTPEGGSIFVVAEQTADGTGQVRVRDTGQGIDAADIDRVFELFGRATRGGDGLGIGLAVARRLVELHDGTITVSSEGAGLGSEFTVTLPVIRPA
jgi:signal transduction histidine kinase